MNRRQRYEQQEERKLDLERQNLIQNRNRVFNELLRLNHPNNYDLPLEQLFRQHDRLLELHDENRRNRHKMDQNTDQRIGFYAKKLSSGDPAEPRIEAEQQRAGMVLNHIISRENHMRFKRPPRLVRTDSGSESEDEQHQNHHQVPPIARRRAFGAGR